MRIGIEIPAPRSSEPFGAWVLDLTGCFAHGRDEATALGDVPAAVERYLRFAAPLGVARPSGPIVVAVHFACFWSGEYEVNATFAVDEEPVTPADVEFVRPMLEATRPPLLAAAERADEGKPGDRSVDEMLHHVATAEWFYATRLEEDPQRLRRHRLADERDPRIRLALIRQWALARIAGLPGLGVAERTHRGERWTPGKVLRRFVYHELDHLRELEARVPARVR